MHEIPGDVDSVGLLRVLPRADKHENSRRQVEKTLVEKLPEYIEKFNTAMDDDFNTADAIAVIFELVKFINTETNEESSVEFAQKLYNVLETLCNVLGIEIKTEKELPDAEIQALIDERQEARKNKDYKRADEIRNMLLDKGIILEDTREGVRWKRA